MSYIVLARKLRPTRFDDLVGQETIAQILKNAIATNRVSHAFLFTGSRGVGKTTAARVLTKAINCLNLQGSDPCEDCQNCRDITSNASPDVFEIDAASNRGIDNIRDLRENIKYAPANCQYKVYIIDEAHMLTLESFNALLKTLEEPPAHVKFILATTDPHKIPQTIISRCQRYDFVRIPLQKMVDYLENVCQAEALDLSRGALETIARGAVGGMRDALTAIDQVISYTGTSATNEEVAQIIGMVDSQSRFQLLKALIEKNSPEAIAHFYSIQERGHDYQEILSDLLQTVKNLSLIHTLTQGTTTLPPTLFQDLAEEEIIQYQTLVAEITIDELQQMFHILLELEEQIKRSSHAQICFEMALIQLTTIQPLVGIVELLEQVQELQGEGNNGGSTSQPKKTQSTVQSSTPHPSSSFQRLSSAFVQQKKGPRGISEEQVHPVVQAMVEEPKILEEKKEVSEEQVAPDAPTTVEELNTVSEPSVMSASQISERQNGTSEKPSEEPELHLPSEEWEAFVAHIQQNSPRWGSVLKNAVLLEKNEHQIQIAFKGSQFANMLPEEKLISLNQMAEAYYQHPIEIVIQKEAQSDHFVTLSEKQQQAIEQERERRRKVAQKDEKTQLILKMFPGSKIVAIQIQEPSL